jgi:hypothetical protein
MGGACSKYGERCVQVLVSKPDGRRILGRPRRRWEDNIRMVIQRVRWGCGLNSYVLGQ